MKRIIASLLIAVFSCAMHAALSQNYPARSIRLITPFEPGGGTDFTARLLARNLAEALGQTVIVDNRTGAGGTIGTDIAAKAPPNGYTLLFTPGSLAVNATLYPKLPFDTLRDLAPVSMIANQGNVVVVHPAVPANSIRELLALMKAKPGQVAYGSGGFGSATYLAPELFKFMSKLEMVHVAFKGTGPALTSTMGGEVQVVFPTISAALPSVKAGKLRPLAVTTARRSTILPELPTVDEAGVPGYEFSTWYGLLVPAGTSRLITGRLNTEVVKIVSSAGIREQFSVLGMDPTPTSPEQFGAYIKSEIEKWGKVIRAAGLKPE